MRLWHVKQKTYLLDWWTKFGVEITILCISPQTGVSHWWLVERLNLFVRYALPPPLRNCNIYLRLYGKIRVLFLFNKLMVQRSKISHISYIKCIVWTVPLCKFGYSFNLRIYASVRAVYFEQANFVLRKSNSSIVCKMKLIFSYWKHELLKFSLLHIWKTVHFCCRLLTLLNLHVCSAVFLIPGLQSITRL